MSDTRDPQSELVLKLGRDPVLAHKFLFAHRHSAALTEAHEDMIRFWHSAEPSGVIEGFRGFGKSSIAEEAVIIKALYRRFKNGLVVSASYPLAEEHLASIATELLHNERINTVFGEQMGEIWGADKIVLANGTCIQAVGRGQKLRGTKFHEQRPDLIYGDDVEDDEDVRTPEARDKTDSWFFKKMLPACAPPRERKVRILGTRLDPDSLLAKLEKGEWPVRKYPIQYVDGEGVLQPLWPERFPFEEIEKEKRSYERRGAIRDYNAEYMCVIDNPQDKPFKKEMFRVEPQLRTWQAVYAVFDPARTVNATSATTGFACWSWIGGRLVVWDAWAKQLMPDEIVKAVFDCAEEHHPVYVGVEEDGLNEFLMQPIRQEQVRRGLAIPVKAMKAPKGKLDFIRGLQPFFNAREVHWAQPLPDLERQLLSFPTGKIDAPNALAYALKMRPGAPVYEDFSVRNVAEEIGPAPGQPCWLCLNATGGLVCGVLVQILDGALRIYADYVREGDPGAVLADIVSAANLDAGRQVRLIAGPQHFDQFHNVGLVQAAKRIPVEVRRGPGPEGGRAQVRSLLQRESRGFAMLLISSEATWTLNAFAGGYARALLKQGVLADYAEEGVYRVLMEGLETLASLLKTGSPDDENDGRNYAFTPGGARYVTAMPGR